MKRVLIFGWLSRAPASMPRLALAAALGAALGWAGLTARGLWGWQCIGSTIDAAGERGRSSDGLGLINAVD